MNIIFENKGEIDPLLMTTFGVNVKEGDNPIGFFGTGLKYGLAILMRHGCGVTVQSGEREFTFVAKTTELRGKLFEFVTMNGETLGFTTELGKKWDLWMAYREVYCNTQDEGGKVYEAEAPSPTAGVTRVIVSGQKFLEIARNHDTYFLSTPPFLKGERIHIHQGQSQVAYFRTVMVGKMSAKPTLYTYNCIGHLDLTEDRTMKHPFVMSHYIASTILTCDDRDVIRDAVTASEHFHESEMDFDISHTPSIEFMEVVGAFVRDRIGKVNRSAVEKYRKHAPGKITPDPVKLNKVEQAMLRKALDFCRNIGFDIQYEISVVESLGSDVLGMAKDDTVYIAHRAFMTGTKCVAGTLIEEHIHLKHDLADCTRPMQNYLLDRMVSLGELAVGEPL